MFGLATIALAHAHAQFTRQQHLLADETDALRAPSALPRDGNVAIVIRGEAFRLGGRNLGKPSESEGGCQADAAAEQSEATRSMMKLLVWPLEERHNTAHAHAARALSLRHVYVRT